MKQLGQSDAILARVLSLAACEGQRGVLPGISFELTGWKGFHYDASPSNLCQMYRLLD